MNINKIKKPNKSFPVPLNEYELSLLQQVVVRQVY